MGRSAIASGHVYFILAEGAESFVKIGYTWQCPWSRAIDLAVGCPLPLRVIGLIAAPKSKENELHDAYRRLHVRGEWFRWRGPIIALLNSLPEPNTAAFHEGRVPKLGASCVECRTELERLRSRTSRWGWRDLERKVSANP